MQRAKSINDKIMLYISPMNIIISFNSCSEYSSMIKLKELPLLQVQAIEQWQFRFFVFL